MNKDTIVVITEGSYSDYQIQGTYIALKDFDPAEVTVVWLKANPKQAAAYCADFAAFIAWIVSEGYLAKHKVAEWHIGSYSDFKEYPNFTTYFGEDQEKIDLEELLK